MRGGTAALAAPEKMEAWIADVRRIETWVREAAVGDRLVYARMASLPAKSVTARAARRLSDAGKVHLFQRRVGDGLIDYEMRRKAPIRSSAHPPSPARAELDGDAARVKLFLRRLVREGRPCPPNAEIGRVTGVGGADRARYAIRKLALAGVLRTEVVAPDTGARIVIFADGQRTVFDGIAGK